MPPLTPHFFPTDHAANRCQQRAISRQMLHAVLAHGSERRDGIFMARSDCLELAQSLAEDRRVLLLQQRNHRSLGNVRFAKSEDPRQQNHIRDLKRLLPAIQRCEGIYVPTDGRTIITVQRLGPAKRRNIFLEKRKPLRQPNREDFLSPRFIRHRLAGGTPRRQI